MIKFWLAKTASEVIVFLALSASVMVLTLTYCFIYYRLKKRKEKLLKNRGYVRELYGVSCVGGGSYYWWIKRETGSRFYENKIEHLRYRELKRILEEEERKT